jgi:hypothetical protein
MENVWASSKWTPWILEATTSMVGCGVPLHFGILCPSWNFGLASQNFEKFKDLPLS